MTRKRVLVLTTTVSTLFLLASVARAEHRTVLPIDRIAAIAHDLEEAAARVHASAEALAHHGDVEEEEALARLHVLEARAAHFHDEVERYYRDPAHTRRDYRRLVAAYYAAEDAMPLLHPTRRVQRDFARVRGLMHELMACYEGGPRPYPHDPSPYRRYGRRSIRFGVYWGR